MAGWGPDTPWRQGQILAAESAIALGLSDSNGHAESIVLVVSHDCDLAYSDLATEPDCEVIVGTVIDLDKVDGRYTEAKHARRLHLPFTGGQTKLAGDFHASNKYAVPKSRLAAPHEPAANVALTPDELSTLQRWLGGRYHRASFPTEFNKRLEPIKAQLGKIIDRTKGHLTGIYFSVDKGHNIERNGEGDLYDLKIFLLENSNLDPRETRQLSSAARSQIVQLFRGQFGKKDAEKNIRLDDVYSNTDEGMTISQSRKLREWRW